MDKNIRIDEIVTRLNAASDAYYGGQEEQMTNYEWDALFDELTALEKATGYVRPDSPTQVTSHSGNEMDGEGEKEAHEYPALSLAKTKKVEELQDWAGERDIWLSWKLDGSTLVATYDGGALTRVLTRGNGTVGTNITYMASAIRGIPAKISDKGHLVVRGEATISYADFEAINDTLEDADDRYANPRNLAAGTLALDKTNLDKVKERNVTFNAFTLVHTDEVIRSWGARMDYLDQMGFTTVERERTSAKDLPDAIARWTKKVDSGEMGIPVDGLVITYDDTDYAATGSVTGHHATRAGLAYKWADVSADTVLDHIEWSCAASTITPVAVFDPVQLEGTTVTRASLCNVSELERLGIGKDRKTELRIIKANKIIPKCIAVVIDKTNLDKVKERNVTFNAFTLVHTDEVIRSWGARMDYLEKLGFITVEREHTDAKNLPDAIARWTKKVDTGEMGIPVDGLVITYDDTDYAATGSVTGHHATRAGLAYKWADVSADTVLDHIEWSCAASTITPVAVFDPVQLEGTTVTRASLCNISELERLGIGKDRKTELRIIKANKIIPKCIAVVRAEGSYEVPTACPVCGAATEVRISPISGVKTLRCTDPNCPAKHLKRFVRFASKGGLDIDGLSVQTLHEFVNRGYLRDFADLYHLDAHADEIVKLEGFGEKSCANLLAAIEKSRKVDPIHLIFALCIPNIGADAGKKLIAALGTKGFLSRIESGEGFEDVDGIGVERSNALLNWFADDENKNLFDRLMAELTLEDVAPKQEADGTCKGLSFVITGDVHLFKNRSAFKAYVEQQGGAVTGSVSGKTTYLVSNDGESNSSKTKKAKELGFLFFPRKNLSLGSGVPNLLTLEEEQIGIDKLL